MKAFTLPGIGKVIPRRGETRQRAETRARREHGRKSLGKAVFVPFVGKVKARKGERFREAVKRKRREVSDRRRRPIIVWQGAESLITFLDDTALTREIARKVREAGRSRITLSGFVQIAPEFTRSEDWSATINIDDLESFDIGAFFVVIRKQYEQRAPSNTVLTLITA